MLSAELAAAYARIALANVQREYPRRLDQLLTGPLPATHGHWRPRALHPAFYGSYDWHSSVHMHWSLAHLLRLYPALEPDVAPTLQAHLQPSAIAIERAFFDAPGGATFERPYGWAWLLELQAELLRLDRVDWSHAILPLAARLADRFCQYIERLPYPVRAGTHGNTAFACVLALDFARTACDARLESAIAHAARRWYGADRDYPVAYEPSADDFLSPALVEAVLMQVVLDPVEFGRWLGRFLPAGIGPLGMPPRVVDHADPKHSHLDGLCLSRAWCFVRLGKTYAAEARRHLEAGLPHVTGGDYAGEHWLVSFALLALSAEALRTP